MLTLTEEDFLSVVLFIGDLGELRKKVKPFSRLGQLRPKEDPALGEPLPQLVDLWPSGAGGSLRKPASRSRIQSQASPTVPGCSGR